MFEEIFNDKNQKRRKGSMLKNSIRFLALLVLLVMPIKAWAGAGSVPVWDTDSPNFQLYYFWDLRDRQSFFQVTNTSNSPITVHVQIFDVPGLPNCDEIDFDDPYTGLDTHVYNLSNLVANDGTVIGPAFPDDGYGLVVVSVLDAFGDADETNNVLIGNFRVIDDEGYEYRVNAAGFIDHNGAFDYHFNFNDVDGTILSDVVGIFVQAAGGGNPEVVTAASEDILINFDPTILNAAEKAFSCPNVVFACLPSDGDIAPFILEEEAAGLVGFDLGINDELVNSKGEPSICGGSLSTGWVDMTTVDIDTDSGFDGSEEEFFVGFIGLNNGDGTGSMDTWGILDEDVVASIPVCSIAAAGPMKAETAMANMLLLALVPAFVIGYNVLRRREKKLKLEKTKRSRFGFIVIAGIMLLFLGIGTSEKANGAVLCPGLDNTTGWFDISLNLDPDANGDTDFTAGLLGTIESLGAGKANIGGIDWLYNDLVFLNTTVTGTQLVSWWSQVGKRNTFIQVTNIIGICSTSGTACADNFDCPPIPFFTNVCTGVNLEVKFLGDDCVELTDFCDPYTPGDTHVYDLGNLVDNNGNDRNDAALKGKEGIFVVTPVNNCDDEEAISWNFLNGNLRLIDAKDDIDYGTNIYTREAVFFQTFENSETFFPGDPCPPNFVLEDETGTCSLLLIQPSQLKQNFSKVALTPAADLVFISFNDVFGPPYGVAPGVTTFTPDDFCNDKEKCDSCPPFTKCFARYGLNDNVPISEDFKPPTPTPAPPTATPPTTPTATPTATAEPPGGGGEGCSIAGSTVQLGTAMANILIPLVPAFAIGYRVLRRRTRKNEK